MHKKYLILLFIIGFAFSSSTSHAVDNLWKAGLASRAITPNAPMWMGGYAARKEPSQGKLHDLFAKAVAIEDQSGNRAVLVTADLIGISREIRLAVQQAVEQKHQLPPHSLAINASHTHCGPELRWQKSVMYQLPEGELDKIKAYGERLKQELVELVGEALADLQPAKVAYTHGRAGFAMNRRLPQGTAFVNRPYADGPVDHDVPVLTVSSPDGKLRGMVFGYACHNTTLGIQKFNGDYAGFAQHYLEEAHPEAVAMFVAGCGGDQNPQPRRTVELAKQHGRALANAVEAALISPATPLTGTIRTAMETIPLKFAPPPSRAELVAQTENGNVYEKKHAQELLSQLETDGKLPETYPYPVQVWRLGEHLLFTALAGETVVDYSLRLKSELQAPRVWIAGYSNDVFAYIPTRRILLEGGYEGGGAMTYTPLPGPWAPSVEKDVVETVHRLARYTVSTTKQEKLYVAKPVTAEHSFTPGIEGPGVDRHGNVFAVNFEKQQTIGRVTPQGDAEVFVTLPNDSVGNGIRFDLKGTMYVADYVNHNVLKIDPKMRNIEVLAHNPDMNQPNDLTMAADGTLYASDPNWGNSTGQLWRIDPDGTTTLLGKNLGTTNGIEVSPDGRTLYVNESVQRKVWAYPLKSDRTLGERKEIASFPDHSLDGMRCDTDGNLYVTRHGAGHLAKLSPSGEELQRIDVLGSMPSNICFGGPDGRTAYVTEVEHGRLVSFRVEKPGLAWQRLYGDK